MIFFYNSLNLKKNAKNLEMFLPNFGDHKLKIRNPWREGLDSPSNGTRHIT
jgi:hypothetical protein